MENLSLTCPARLLRAGRGVRDRLIVHLLHTHVRDFENSDDAAHRGATLDDYVAWFELFRPFL